MKNIIKNLGNKIAYVIIGLVLAISGTAYAATTVFKSNQLASSPSAGQVLQTDGTNSSWVATSTLGIVGGGSGSISTSTTAQIGKVAPWTGLGTLGNGSLFDNGTVSGVNATTSLVSFNVQGSGSRNPFNVASSTGTALFTIATNGSTTISSLTNALPVRSTSGGFLFNGAINLAGSDVTGVLPVANGGTGTTTGVTIPYVVSFNAGGVALAGGATKCIPIGPVGTSGSLVGVRLQATNGYDSDNAPSAGGSATFDIRTTTQASYASSGTSTAATIKSSGSLLSLSSVYAADGDLTSWTLTSFAGKEACVVMTSPTALDVDVIMYVR